MEVLVCISPTLILSFCIFINFLLLARTFDNLSHCIYLYILFYFSLSMLLYLRNILSLPVLPLLFLIYFHSSSLSNINIFKYSVSTKKTKRLPRIAHAGRYIAEPTAYLCCILCFFTWVYRIESALESLYP